MRTVHRRCCSTSMATAAFSSAATLSSWRAVRCACDEHVAELSATSAHLFRMSARSRYADMPLPQILFRYVWPFWLFKDATRGDRYARAAAYRHRSEERRVGKECKSGQVLCQ